VTYDKNNKDLWDAKTLDDILCDNEQLPATTRKRAHSDNGDSESVAVTELDDSL